VIYDGFLFFNELDLLELRLHELDSVVDKFVLLESTVTFTGKPKPLYFQDNKHLFEKFLGKIIHVVVSDTPIVKDPWTMEAYQRNAILRGMTNLTPADNIIISDLDEIPKAETLRKIIPVKRPVTLRMKSYGGYVNARSGDWVYAKVLPTHVFSEMLPEKIRHENYTVIEDGGWHFSSCGGPKRVHEKMNAFSHQEPSVQKWNKLDRLERDLPAGIGLFGGKMSFERLDESFPRYLVEHQDRFPGLIWPV
jgi:beta-1,4-mannosyl-glycoprotein beta-1,4-N-acetylglucosaminyltransferase